METGLRALDVQRATGYAEDTSVNDISRILVLWIEIHC